MPASPMPLLHRVLEHPIAFSLNQMINPWTVASYADFVRTKVGHDSRTRILDIGCGIGAHRALLSPCIYQGIDINPAYIAEARRRFGDEFAVMDAAALKFDNASFDTAVSVATCHHLSDETIRAMIGEVMRVVAGDGIFHIIDPVLPLNPSQRFKRWLFENDRGRFQRTIGQMKSLLTSCARLVAEDLHRGPMHDVCYMALARR